MCHDQLSSTTKIGQPFNGCKAMCFNVSINVFTKTYLNLLKCGDGRSPMGLFFDTGAVSEVVIL